VSWQGPGGKRLEAQGLTQDISRSGIYFIVPAEVRTDLPVELDVILPDEITHRGDTALEFIAQRVRQELVNGALSNHGPSVAVAAHLMARGNESVPQEANWFSKSVN
jgi:hypothetical protein